MNKTELKPVGELQAKIEKLYTKYKEEMLQKFIRICNKNDVDYWQMHDMIIGCFALPITATDENQYKFMQICAAMGTISTTVVMFYPDMAASMRNDVDKLKKQVHEYDAPWYWDVVDQVRILA